VVAMIAFLRKAERLEVMPYVHAGWIGALLAGLLTWGVATWAIGISGDLEVALRKINSRRFRVRSGRCQKKGTIGRNEMTGLLGFTLRRRVAALLALLLVLPHIVVAQDLGERLVGVWRLTSGVDKVVSTGQLIKTMGQNPTGIATFSRGGHFAYIFIDSGRRGAPSPLPSDDNLARLYNTAFFGSGTYRVAGDQARLLYTTSFNEVWTGTERTANMHIYGRDLIWASDVFKHPGGAEVVTIFTFERLE